MQMRLNLISACVGLFLTSPFAWSQTIGTIPSAPTGSTPTTTVFTQSTATGIPTGPAVVTSTLVVSGAGTSLWDLNLRTFITHTFSSDLDISIASPAGTVVTLTTDNGGGNDNNFNGTVWDDQANLGGQVPYTTNDGLVTDHAYINLTLASPLVPEEAMAAFRGEDPNGTWTITISDDLAGDGGSLATWDLEITTFPAAPTETTTTFTQSTAVAIPTGPAVVTSTLVVSGVGTSLIDLLLTTNLTHTQAMDLDITLMSPAGTVVTLSTDNGGGNDDVFDGTIWSDQANSGGQLPYSTNDGLVTDHAYVNLTTATTLVPEEAMAAFAGEDPNGTWTITISDDLANEGGSLDSWSLDVVTGSGSIPGTGLALKSLRMTSNWRRANSDRVTLAVLFDNPGAVPAPGAAYPFAGSTVDIDIGGQVFNLVLDAKGKDTATNGRTLKVKYLKRTNQLLVVLRSPLGDYQDQWLDEGLTNAPAGSVELSVPVSILYDATSFDANVRVRWWNRLNAAGNAIGQGLDLGL